MRHRWLLHAVVDSRPLEAQRGQLLLLLLLLEILLFLVVALLRGLTARLRTRPLVEVQRERFLLLLVSEIMRRAVSAKGLFEKKSAHIGLTVGACRLLLLLLLLLLTWLGRMMACRSWRSSAATSRMEEESEL